MTDEKTADEKVDPFDEGRDLIEVGLGNIGKDTANFKNGFKDRISFHEFNALNAWEVFADACEFFTKLEEEEWSKFSDEEKERVDIFARKLAANGGDLQKAGIAEDEFKKLGDCFSIHQALVAKDSELKKGYASYKQSLIRVKKLKALAPSWTEKLLNIF